MMKKWFLSGRTFRFFLSLSNKKNRGKNNFHASGASLRLLYLTLPLFGPTTSDS